MDHNNPARRSYTEKELRALIQRATELHEEASGGSERRLSLEDIEHIAAELGLPPEHMRTAALELEHQRSTGKPFRLWGAPFVIDQARVVDAEMTQEQWEQMVMELRAFTGKKGQTDEVGRAREWLHAVGEGDQGFNFVKTRVVLRPEDGRTSIHIRKQYGGAAIPAYVLAFFGSIFAAIVMIEAFEGMGLPDSVNFAILGMAALGALAAVRGSIGAWARRQQERFNRLTDRLHHILSSSSPQTLANPSTAAQIDLPEPNEAEHEEAERIATPTGRRTRA